MAQQLPLLTPDDHETHDLEFCDCSHCEVRRRARATHIDEAAIARVAEDPEDGIPF